MRRYLLVLVSVLGTGCSQWSDNQFNRHDLGAGPDQISTFRNAAPITDAVDGLSVGHRAMAAGEYEIALRAYHRAAGLQGPTIDVLTAIGSANLRLGRLQQAEADLRRALEKDEQFVPAHNNLGVVLAEQGRWGEASLHFRNAFALDAGRSPEIRQNLRLAIEKREETVYDEREDHQLVLMRRGRGSYLLLSTPL